MSQSGLCKTLKQKEQFIKRTQKQNKTYKSKARLQKDCQNILEDFIADLPQPYPDPEK